MEATCRAISGQRACPLRARRDDDQGESREVASRGAWALTGGVAGRVAGSGLFPTSWRRLGCAAQATAKGRARADLGERPRTPRLQVRAHEPRPNRLLTIRRLPARLVGSPTKRRPCNIRAMIMKLAVAKHGDVAGGRPSPSRNGHGL